LDIDAAATKHLNARLARRLALIPNVNLKGSVFLDSWEQGGVYLENFKQRNSLSIGNAHSREGSFRRERSPAVVLMIVLARSVGADDDVSLTGKVRVGGELRGGARFRLAIRLVCVWRRCFAVGAAILAKFYFKLNLGCAKCAKTCEFLRKTREF
jgi:hypothetical protein